MTLFSSVKVMYKWHPIQTTLWDAINFAWRNRLKNSIWTFNRWQLWIWNMWIKQFWHVFVRLQSLFGLFGKIFWSVFFRVRKIKIRWKWIFDKTISFNSKIIFVYFSSDINTGIHKINVFLPPFFFFCCRSRYDRSRSFSVFETNQSRFFKACN